VSVCLSVNTITPEPLEMSSKNVPGIILWSKGRPSSKMAIVGCAGGDKTSLVQIDFDVQYKVVIGGNCRIVSRLERIR